MQYDDMEAIDAYMHKTIAKTPEAQSLQSSWQSWYGGLSFWQKQFDDDAYTSARIRRNNFNAANATTPAEAAAVEQVVTTGFTTEQMEGTGARTPTALRSTSKSPQQAPGTRPVLRRWQHNDPEYTKQWQRILGLYPDGKFGKDTEKGTKQFQSAHGLPVTGIVDAATWAASSVVSSQQPVTPLPAQPYVDTHPSMSTVFTPPKPGSRTTGFRAVSKKADAGPPPDTLPGKAIAGTKEALSKVSQAGIFSGLSTLPTPVKVVGGGLAVGGALYYGMRYKKLGHF